MPDCDPTADAFMARILADPADPLPRLVFADWLEETGAASNVAWARYLRLAEELAAAPADDPRRLKLTDELGRVGGLVRASLTYRAEVFVAHPEAMLRLMPRRCMLLDLTRVIVPRSLCDSIPAGDVRELGCLPLAVVCGRLCLAASDTWLHVSHPSYHFDRSPLGILIPAIGGQLGGAIDRHYPPPPPPPAPAFALNPAA